MAKVIIDPGVCGFDATVEAISDDGMEVVLKVDSGCPAITAMFDELGDTFDGYELLFAQPGTNPLYEYAADNFPQHGGCVTIAGITKAVEVALGMALPTNASITIER
ncbi:MAG: hypothetical protein LBU61_05990 [Coriobacteriales bacterium]|jgi:hypothetical protein|nr:hypothetical protein [Coriobacteriales bacterium]